MMITRIIVNSNNDENNSNREIDDKFDLIPFAASEVLSDGDSMIISTCHVMFNSTLGNLTIV